MSKVADMFRWSSVLVETPGHSRQWTVSTSFVSPATDTSSIFAQLASQGNTPFINIMITLYRFFLCVSIFIEN